MSHAVARIVDVTKTMRPTAAGVIVRSRPASRPQAAAARACASALVAAGSAAPAPPHISFAAWRHFCILRSGDDPCAPVESVHASPARAVYDAPDTTELRTGPVRVATRAGCKGPRRHDASD